MTDYLTLLSYGPDGWGDEIVSGVLVTVFLGLATLPIGLVLGFFLALGINAKEKTVQASAKIFTTIFRGLPELLTLFIVYYGGQILINLLFQKVFGIHVEVNSFVAGMIALSFVFASYSSEVFLSAFKGINQGQYEGAFALGLSWPKTMRLIIIPQLIKLALPGLSNLWLIMLKETSLVSVIGLADTMRQTGLAARNTKEAFLFFSIACLIYLALTFLSSVGLERIEKRVRRGEVRS
ncbi:amino acid ABC transporter membrane protein 1, PAAT family (TC 3.A.1.3.-) [Cohaesibacter sp. ES.047]|uniref:ABC transporter permease n=1 Tax=Cohaesibacter sp. ES.047 TaxID=1798205 RepID=UPI000BB94910|nr:ABC transporter permease [Cohaesibacter sp. ES.047]SNY93022.1 amino acid ABC transporter membrane protein 1, PAAT family (TC 3.A.1.3.-) [Cohaesibacter sp. ES.047]